MKIKDCTKVINSTVPRYGNPLFFTVDNFYYDEPIPRKWSRVDTPTFVQDYIIDGLNLEKDFAILAEKKSYNVLLPVLNISVLSRKQLISKLSCDEQFKKRFITTYMRWTYWIVNFLICVC